MEQIELQAEMRTVIGRKVSQLRRAGLVPAILYGHNTAPIPLQVPARALLKVLLQAGGNRLISLQTDDGRVRMVLAKAVQHHPTNQTLLHADFQEVVMTEKITADVPIELIGESPPVEEGLALLLQGMDHLTVQCLPGDLPPALAIDLSRLTEPDQAIYVRDLKVAGNVELLSDPEEMVVKLLRARRPAEEEVEEIVEEERAEPEVLSERRRAERLAEADEDEG